jgi:two-component system response regulator YesN
MVPVLIVDDEPLVRVSLRTTVPWARHGFACLYEAASAEEALRVLSEHPETALVLLDLVMPRMDGLELLRRLGARGPLPEVIVLTAHDEFAMVREAFKLGAREYLLKSELEPRTLEPLLAAAAERIRRSGGRPAVAPWAEGLKQELLRRILEAEEGGDMAALAAEAERRALRLRGTLRLGLLTVEDFDTVAARYDGDSPVSFSPTVIALVEQVLARRSAGEICRLADDQYVLLLSFERRHSPRGLDDACREVCGEIEQALAGYLNVRVRISLSDAAALSSGPSPASLLRALLAGRSRPSRLAVRARELLLRELADPELNLRAVAERLGVTPNHLSATFARDLGKPFREYLNFARVQAAKRLLLDSGLKVYEVAERVGYLNIEVFSRVFKRLAGTPPHQWSRGSPG